MTHADNDAVELSVPLRPEFASMLRTVTSSIGADLGLDLDQIDDLRLAVSESFSLLLEQPRSEAGEDELGGARSRCRATFGVEGDVITIVIGRDEAGDRPALDELAEAILSTVVDEHHLSEDGVVLVKRVVTASSTS